MLCNGAFAWTQAKRSTWRSQPTSLASCRTFAKSALPCSGSSSLTLRILACGELLGFQRTVLQMVANSNLSRFRSRRLEEISVNPAVGYSEASVSNLKQTPFAGGPHTRKVIALFCYRIKKWGGAFAVRSRVSVRLIRANEAPMKGSTVCRVPGPAQNQEDWTLAANTLFPELLSKMDAYWRAANYLAVGQIYLHDNPLLKRPLTLADVKHMLVGHWGTTPGQNFIYSHLGSREFDQVRAVVGF